MRKDASSISEWELSPTDISTMGHAKSAYWDVNRACEKWLTKRGMGVSYRHSFSRKVPLPPQVKEPVEEVKVKAFVPTFSVPRDRKKRVRQKYASAEERKQAKSELAKAQWARMTPEERASRVRKCNSSRKMEMPRWKRESWKEYKRTWDRRKRAETQLSQEEIDKRRQQSRALYEKHKHSPEFKAKQKARKERYREKLKAKKAASV